MTGMLLPGPATYPGPAVYPSGYYLSYDGTLGRVLVDLAQFTGHGWVRVQRSPNQLAWSDVRGASGLPLMVGMLPLSDYEFAADVVNYYRVQAACNPNPGFEQGTSGWTASNGATVTQSAAWRQDGLYSGLVTGDGATAGPTITTAPFSVQPGDIIAFGPWLYSPQGWDTVEVGVSLLDFAGNVLDSDSQTVTLAAGAVAQAPEATLTVTGSGQQAVGWITLAGTPANTVQVFADDAAVYGAAALTYSGQITPMIGGPWLKNVVWPFLNVQVSLSDATDITRPARSSTFTVLGRANQVAISLPRGGRQFTITVATQTDDENAAVQALLATGDVIFVQVPAGYTVPMTGYYSVGDTTETRQGVAWARRWTSVPLTEVDPPAADITGPQSNWQTVLNEYSSWAALVAGQASWSTVITLIGTPADEVTQ